MSVDVARLVKEASEAAKHAPEHLQEAAFNRAFELLAGAPPATDSKRTSNNLGLGRRAVAESDNGALQRETLDGLDRTAHPEINHDGTALLNALRLLRAAKDDLLMDGLSAATISQTLVDKFRCRITRQAVSIALNRAGRYVNRHKEGGAVIFRIMGPGEQHLDSVAQSASQAGAVEKSPRSKRPSVRTKTAGTDNKPKEKEQNEAESGTSRSVRQGTGAWAATTRLLGEGFFKSRRVIGAIVEHMKEKEGRRHKAHEISPALLRLLRDKKLLRAKNGEGQYEYWQA